jgi:hypothetical protein
MKAVVSAHKIFRRRKDRPVIQCMQLLVNPMGTIEQVNTREKI